MKEKGREEKKTKTKIRSEKRRIKIKGEKN